ncbi:MAG: hypothetical protein ACFE0Q_02130 [Anaerolineae bacterium]
MTFLPAIIRQGCFFGVILALLVACLPRHNPSYPPQDVTIGERLLNETFTHIGTWSRYQTDEYSATIMQGGYQLLLNVQGQYIWGSDGTLYTDTVLDIDVHWSDQGTDAIAGVICRLHPDDGRGYYVVVSESGAFSIRYIAHNTDDALVHWQSHENIPQTGAFQMRVICVEDEIALYINGRYIDGVRDRRLRDGQIGLALGMPMQARGSALVTFDNLRVWRGNLP